MSLYGMMRTGSSGMNAQASRLSTVAENIANANTTGYKKASTEFSSLILPSGSSSYNSGAVNANVRYSISQSGTQVSTSSSTDLAIGGSGKGFFIVQDDNGAKFLTRAGSFIPDAQGNLVNAAGFTLMGYDYNSGPPAPVVNGFDGLVPVNIATGSLSATPSTSGKFTANLPAGADITPAADAASTNTVNSKYTNKSSLITYDNLGKEVLIDFYYTKTADNTWEVAAYDRAGATPGTGFPYTGGPLATQTLTFDTAGTSKGRLSAGSANQIAFNVPGGENLVIDLQKMTQLNYPYAVSETDTDVNGNKPSAVKEVKISEEGTVMVKFEEGDLEPRFRIALANVTSPDNLTPLAGNVYSQGVESGVITTGFAGTGSFGKVISNALESSNVDMAEELTNMIASQRSYTANSKVFQTGSDLMDVLVNLKR